jgi:hypothetical protein
MALFLLLSSIADALVIRRSMGFPPTVLRYSFRQQHGVGLLIKVEKGFVAWGSY